MKHSRTAVLEILRSKLRGLIIKDAENTEEALLTDELEEQIILNVRASFLSNDEIAEECMEYILEDYPEVKPHISVCELQEVVKGYRDKYGNAGKQENYLKLASAFQKLNEQGIVALHCAGYVQTDGFDDCNEIAVDMEENGETVIGSCFYTLQDLEHVLNEDTTKLRISFGNYSEKPTAVEIGKMIVKELEEAGFVTEWRQSADEKIAISDMVWDKVFETKGNALFQQFTEAGMGDFIMEHGVLKKYTGSDETVVIPDGITEIGFWAFMDCTSLTNITIPDSVKSLDGTIFNGCTSLASLTLPVSKYRISDALVLSIDGKKLLFCIPGLATGDIAIPEGTAVIADYAFVGCENLAGIHIPDSVKTIGNTAFCGCSGLTGLTLPGKVRKIEEAAFQECTGLANIIIPSGVRKIHKRTFCGCTNLKSVTIPDGVRKIDKTAFEDCDLTKLTICATVGSYAEEFAMKNKFSFSAI